jgi:enterochelin esterase-like enzyme
MKVTSMIRTILAILALWLQVLSVNAGTLSAHTFHSSLLNRTYSAAVYLPDAYAAATSTKFPVLYLLHGGGEDNESTWGSKGEIKSIMDGMITRGEVPPMLVVMPGDYQSYWVDGNGPPSQSALLKEVIPSIERTYRVQGTRSGRLIAGHSAGGYGAVNAVLRYPTLFAAAAALSPAVWDPEPDARSQSRQYAPFLVDGKFSAETWRRLNWPALLDGYKAQGTKVPLYISSGDHDRLNIAVPSVALFRAMRSYQPDIIELRIVDGDHEWSVWRPQLQEALRYMQRFISTSQ